MGAGVAKVKHALLTQGILRCQQLGGDLILHHQVINNISFKLHMFDAVHPVAAGQQIRRW